MPQFKTASSSEMNEVPPIVHEALRSTGQPLNAATRAFMESRLGRDFSGVRIYTDARAAESARAVNALAYTVGRNVIFGEGQYAPETSSGRRLIAHELAHVAQQSCERGGSMSLSVSDSESRHEREADDIAQAVVADRPAPGVTPSPSAIQRQAGVTPSPSAVQRQG